MADKHTTTTVAGAKISESEIKDAKKEGALDYVKQGGERAMAVDTGTTGDVEAAAEAERLRVAPDLPTTFLAPLLDLPVEDLTKRLTNDKLHDAIPFEHAKGLLALERAGRNRTGYVQALCKALGVKSPVEVTSAGPAYTDDTSNVTPL